MTTLKQLGCKNAGEHEEAIFHYSILQNLHPRFRSNEESLKNLAWMIFPKLKADFQFIGDSVPHEIIKNDKLFNIKCEQKIRPFPLNSLD